MRGVWGVGVRWRTAIAERRKREKREGGGRQRARGER